jgi:glycosyltransferase involved in cell wall biosynthesis
MIDQGSTRLALFLPNLPVGGVERVTANLAAGLVTLGFAVDVVLADGRNEQLDLAPTIRVVDLGARRTFGAVLPLARYLRRVRPGALLAAKDHANVVAVMAATLSRAHVPLAVAVHALPSQSLRDPERWSGHVVRRLLPVAYRHADRVVAISDGVARDVVALAPAVEPRVRVVANPIITPELTQCAGAGDRSDAAGIEVMWCGRLTAEKDPLTAIDAFARVRAAIDARFVVCGDGPLRESVRARVDELELHDHVEIAGTVADVPRRLARADVYVSSSRREGVPTTIVEALAVGTQVVATDCGPGPRELLGDGEFGRLVPVEDASALGHAIVDTVSRPKPSPPAAVLAPFTVEHAVARYAGLLAEMGVRP